MKNLRLVVGPKHPTCEVYPLHHDPDNFHEVATCYNDVGGEAARRIAACVSACASVETEVLERIAARRGGRNAL